MYKIKKKDKEIGTKGNRRMRRNPNTKKDPKGRKGKSMPEGKGNPPVTPGAKTVPMSAEDQILVKGYLANGVGESLIRTMEPLARRDLHPGNLIIAYNKEMNAIDISIVFVETNQPLWANLQVLMWRNRMTWRFDSAGPQLMLIVRWFLPYLFMPEKQKETTTHVPTAEEEVGQTKESTLEPPVQALVEDALEPPPAPETPVDPQPPLKAVP